MKIPPIMILLPVFSQEHLLCCHSNQYRLQISYLKNPRLNRRGFCVSQPLPYSLLKFSLLPFARSFLIY
jgi:hypothetical protein